ncbi:MAG: flagellar motor stator protein MotA [Holosporales bacterium]
MFWAGVAIVFVCVFGGYIVMGGNILVIAVAAPKEMLIIGGAAVGAFLIANSKVVVGKMGPAFQDLLRGPMYGKQDYLELLSLMYMIFKLTRTKGMLALEQHIENPHESKLFQQFPKIMNDHHVVTFLCDYLRMMTMGTDDPHQMEDLMNEEMETHHKERHAVSHAFTNMGDGLPALGIVAAVLGVIKTMGSIDQPPVVLGKMIGGALVGTFLGVLLAYGLVSPIGTALSGIYDEEGRFYQCIKTGIIAFLSGAAPTVALEFARKTISSDNRPSFYDVEQAVANLPSPE